MTRLVVVAVLVFAAVGHAMAQQAAVPEPILKVAIDPPRVVVGQRTTLRIDVLAPNYMTSPPELPGFQVRNAITRQLQNVNLSEERNGTSFAGVRFEFAVYPQEPGSYAISDHKLKVTYAAEPPAVREETLALPRLAFAAFIPDAAAGLNPFLAANRLTIEQSVQRSSEQLRVGDSVSRNVTVRAEEIPAMLLPPVTFPPVDGLAVYPAQPVLEDKTDGRTDALTATRTDSTTYILQRAGEYVLPAIDVRWWNVAEGRIETAHLDSVTMQVAVNPAVQTAGANAPARRSNWAAIGDFVLDHWIGAILALAGLAVLGWIVPRGARAIATHYRRHRLAYLHSEQFSFDRLRHVVRSGDARQSYFALLEWLQRFGPAGSVTALKAAARDPVLERELTSLEAQLFACQPNSTADWSPRRFSRHIGSARRSLRKESIRREALTALPTQLNPDGDHIPPYQWRRPAR